MAVDVIIEDDRWTALGLPDLAERSVAAALRAVRLDPSAWETSLLACDDARIASLNADFRGKPMPTNVLSWPSAERGSALDGQAPMPPDVADVELGDIAIAFDTCAREAVEAGKSLEDHVTHLIVHGTLHLLGYDHERDADATLMEALETQILGKMGLDDPYRVTAQRGS